MSVIGSMAAMGHAAADDAILKDTFADYAFEHYEMAAYKSLITIGRTVGANNALPLLQENLDEETAMADWLDQHIEPVTLKYLSLRQVGEQAKH